MAGDEGGGRDGHGAGGEGAGCPERGGRQGRAGGRHSLSRSPAELVCTPPHNFSPSPSPLPLF